MPNRENNVSRAENISKHMGKLGNIVSTTKMFLNFLGNIFSSQEANFVSATMFPSLPRTYSRFQVTFHCKISNFDAKFGNLLRSSKVHFRIRKIFLSVTGLLKKSNNSKKKCQEGVISFFVGS